MPREVMPVLGQRQAVGRDVETRGWDAMTTCSSRKICYALKKSITPHVLRLRDKDKVYVYIQFRSLQPSVCERMNSDVTNIQMKSNATTQFRSSLQWSRTAQEPERLVVMLCTTYFTLHYVSGFPSTGGWSGSQMP